MTYKDIFFKVKYQFKGAPVELGGHSIRLDESLRRWDVSSEKCMFEAMEQHLGHGDTAIDVGANFGLHSIYASNLVGETGKVFAFEPVPQNLRLLKRNLALNNLNLIVNVVPSAISNSESDFIEFYVPNEEVAVTASLNKRDDGEAIRVKNLRLDDYWADINLPVSLIKIDVEGAEFEVLKGCRELLGRDHPTLIIEVHGFALPDFNTSLEEIQTFLKDLGYEEHRFVHEAFQGDDYFQALYV